MSSSSAPKAADFLKQVQSPRLKKLASIIPDSYLSEILKIHHLNWQDADRLKNTDIAAMDRKVYESEILQRLNLWIAGNQFIYFQGNKSIDEQTYPLMSAPPKEGFQKLVNSWYEKYSDEWPYILYRQLPDAPNDALDRLPDGRRVAKDLIVRNDGKLTGTQADLQMLIDWVVDYKLAEQKGLAAVLKDTKALPYQLGRLTGIAAAGLITAIAAGYVTRTIQSEAYSVLTTEFIPYSSLSQWDGFKNDAQKQMAYEQAKKSWDKRENFPQAVTTEAVMPFRLTFTNQRVIETLDKQPIAPNTQVAMVFSYNDHGQVVDIVGISNRGLVAVRSANTLLRPFQPR